jgi:hypothetical protein
MLLILYEYETRFIPPCFIPLILTLQDVACLCYSTVRNGRSK